MVYQCVSWLSNIYYFQQLATETQTSIAKGELWVRISILMWNLPRFIQILILIIYWFHFKVIPIILSTLKRKLFTYYLFSANDVAEEVISAMRTVKSFACEKYESQRFVDFLDITLGIATRKSLAHVGFLWTSEVGLELNKPNIVLFSFFKWAYSLSYSGMVDICIWLERCWWHLLQVVPIIIGSVFR